MTANDAATVSPGSRSDTPLLELVHATKSFGAVKALEDGSVRSTPAKRTRWSARTAPESRRWSRSWPACTTPTAATCSSTASAPR